MNGIHDVPMYINTNDIKNVTPPHGPLYSPMFVKQLNGKQYVIYIYLYLDISYKASY